MTTVDLVFPVGGESLPTDHAYLLYSALSRAVPDFHTPDGGLRFAPINGEPAGPGVLRLFRPTPARPHFSSVLRVRAASDRIETAFPLSGRALPVGEHSIRLGPPRVEQLQPVPTLRAGFVTFKDFGIPCQRSVRRHPELAARRNMPREEEPAHFIETAARRLKELKIEAEPGIPRNEKGARAGEPRRRIVHIKGKKIVGYPLIVQGLMADESIRLQEVGLGGRTRIGCGFFVPYRERAP
ncbi:MAG: type I-MYXAN CRISPR-associated protein Cas6/Cmx6 [Zavarzinella sp.]|nr:type I-MYXAN CRISPR-associated protein Cas6/Cmx6 [Zavarzinella sp.]